MTLIKAGGNPKIRLGRVVFVPLKILFELVKLLQVSQYIYTLSYQYRECYRGENSLAQNINLIFGQYKQSLQIML